MLFETDYDSAVKLFERGVREKPVKEAQRPTKPFNWHNPNGSFAGDRKQYIKAKKYADEHNDFG